MKERPILFSGEMVRAILDGRKTQTRRVMKPQPDHFHVFDGVSTPCGSDLGLLPGPTCTGEIPCPYGKPGDRLWVREAFYCNDYRYPHAEPSELLEEMMYRADHESPCRCEEPLDGHWKPSIHMPRWASRITLEVTNVRVERLQEISEEDAWAEGVRCLPMHNNDCYGEDFRDAFQRIWDDINGKKHPWRSNPFVWVVEFKKL